jgi:hypothetical protein
VDVVVGMSVMWVVLVVLVDGASVLVVAAAITRVVVVGVTTMRVVLVLVDVVRLFFLLLAWRMVDEVVVVDVVVVLQDQGRGSSRVRGPRPEKWTWPQYDRRAACLRRQAHPGGRVPVPSAAWTARRAQPT